MGDTMYSIEKSKGFSVLKNFDYLLFFSIFLLSLIGLAVLRSATLAMPGNLNGDKIMLVQFISWIIGIVIAIIMCSLDYKDFRNFGIILYIISIILLILVLFFGTGDQLNSKSWFKLPYIGGFQPSELAKIAFIIMTAFYFEKIKEGNKDKNRNVIKLIGLAFLPIMLIGFQPDAGTALVYMFSLMVMLFIYGIHYKYIAISLIFMVPVILYLWFFKLASYQKSRILVFFNQDMDLQGGGYNVYKSKIAIGSGQFFGKGPFQGIQTQNNGVPVKESDFIFSVIGEELGFLGTALIIILIAFVLLRCLYIAKNSRDSFGSFIVMGLVSMLAFHYIENISMTIGVMPVTGIPMPFFSQGGSALITNFMSMGIILSVSMRRKRSIFKN